MEFVCREQRTIPIIMDPKPKSSERINNVIIYISKYCVNLNSVAQIRAAQNIIT